MAYLQVGKYNLNKIYSLLCMLCDAKAQELGTLTQYSSQTETLLSPAYIIFWVLHYTQLIWWKKVSIFKHILAYEEILQEVCHCDLLLHKIMHLQLFDFNSILCQLCLLQGML